MKTKNRKFSIIFSVLIAMLLSGCATTPTATPEDVVKERAEARWAALLSRDYPAAYSFYSPGYRSTIKVTDFEFEIRLRRVRWTSAEYQTHECEGNTCKVSFKVGYTVNSPVPGIKTWNSYDYIDDQWIKTGGEWWFLPEEM
jgi:hypothetical protein